MSRFLRIVGTILYPVVAAVAGWNHLLFVAPRSAIAYLSGTAVFVVGLVVLRDSEIRLEMLGPASAPFAAYLMGLAVVVLVNLVLLRRPS
jgi:hypothetical protein